MSCYHPIPCARGVEIETGKVGIYFQPGPPKGVRYIEGLTVPCGKCIGCRLDHSRQWATRCVHEAKMHKENSFLTLTYNQEHLPKNGSLVVRDMQLFWKRLRKEIAPIKLRYFQCGEYGSLLNRPHYHAILFGFDFHDKYLFSSNHGHPIYRSPLLEKIWSDEFGHPIGYCSIGEVTFESCAYVARYCMKKINGDKAEQHYQGRKPEYVVMSRRPGIGADWLKTYLTDVYPADKCLVRQGTNGEILPLRPPKYYDAIYDTIDPDGMEAIKARRKDAAKIQHNSSYVDLWQKIALILLEFTQMCSVAAKTTQGKKCYDLFLAPLLQTLKKSVRMERLPCGVIRMIHPSRFVKTLFTIALVPY